MSFFLYAWCDRDDIDDPGFVLELVGSPQFLGLDVVDSKFVIKFDCPIFGVKVAVLRVLKDDEIVVHSSSCERIRNLNCMGIVAD